MLLFLFQDDLAKYVYSNFSTYILLHFRLVGECDALNLVVGLFPKIAKIYIYFLNK